MAKHDGKYECWCTDLHCQCRGNCENTHDNGPRRKCDDCLLDKQQRKSIAHAATYIANGLCHGGRDND